MFAVQEDVFFYITAMNENYAHPGMPKGAEQGILKGMLAAESFEGTLTDLYVPKKK